MQNTLATIPCPQPGEGKHEPHSHSLVVAARGKYAPRRDWIPGNGIHHVIVSQEHLDRTGGVGLPDIDVAVCVLVSELGPKLEHLSRKTGWKCEMTTLLTL